MAGILVYALHDDEGNFNKNSLGALSEAAKLAGELGPEDAAVVVGDVSDEGAAALGNYGVSKVYRAKGVSEGLAQPIVDVMAKIITDDGFSYALFGGGLLGFEIGAGLTARTRHQFYDQRLPEIGRDNTGENAGVHVMRTTRSKGNDQGYGFFRKRICNRCSCHEQNAS